MTTINVSPKHSIVEATLFDGSPAAAYEIMGILRAAAQATQNYSLSMTYSENGGQLPELYFYLNNDAYNLRSGDYLIKDDTLFGICRANEYDLRYATEAGLS